MSTPTPITREALQERYEFLCKHRDETEVRIAPLRAKLKKAADEAEVYRVKAMAVADELKSARGPDWFALKKEIGMLAKALGGK